MTTVDNINKRGRLLLKQSATDLDWSLCHRATEQWLNIVLRYDGTMASPSLIWHLEYLSRLSAKCSEDSVKISILILSQLEVGQDISSIKSSPVE